MADEGHDVNEGDHLDVLVSEWVSLQEDIRDYKKESHRRIIRGLIVLAAVAGYAFRSNQEWLVGFIPLIIGLMFVVQIQETNHVYYRNWQSYLIEKKVQEYGIERFDWVEKFGPMKHSDSVYPDGWTSYNISKWQVPAGTPYLIGFLVYGFFIGYTIDHIITTNVDPLPFLPGPLLVWLSLVYGSLTLGLVVAGRSNFRIRDKFKETELS